MNTFISLKKLWYGDVMTEAPTAANIATLVNDPKFTEVKNVHGDTWGYEESDPETTEYMNALTGVNYYVDMTKQGVPTIKFTMGEYEYKQKADLQGGKVITGTKTNPVGWQKATELSIVYKSVVALSKTGVYIVFPKAQITGKGDTQEKNIGLGVTALCVEPDTAGLSAEYWLKSDVE